MKENKVIVCIQCGETFPLTETEWRRLEARGFDQPRRCPECRRKKSKNVISSEIGPRNKDKWKKGRRRKNEDHDLG